MPHTCLCTEGRADQPAATPNQQRAKLNDAFNH
jgi:hypothetical protein